MLKLMDIHRLTHKQHNYKTKQSLMWKNIYRFAIKNQPNCVTNIIDHLFINFQDSFSELWRRSITKITSNYCLGIHLHFVFHFIFKIFAVFKIHLISTMSSLSCAICRLKIRYCVKSFLVAVEAFLLYEANF